MARKAMIIKASKAPKFSNRVIRRCQMCGRPRSYMRQFGLCRICFREYASRGQVPGITKSSW